MSDWIEFFTHNWIFLIILFLIGITILSGIFELAGILIVISLVMIFVFDYTPSQIIDMGKNAYNQVYTLYEDNLKGKLDAELNDAVYEANPDGSYLIKTKSFVISGQEGGNNLNFVYGDTSFNLHLDQVGVEIAEKIRNLQMQNANSTIEPKVTE